MVQGLFLFPRLLFSNISKLGISNWVSSYLCDVTCCSCPRHPHLWLWRTIHLFNSYLQWGNQSISINVNVREETKLTYGVMKRIKREMIMLSDLGKDEMVWRRERQNDDWYAFQEKILKTVFFPPSLMLLGIISINKNEDASFVIY